MPASLYLENHQITSGEAFLARMTVAAGDGVVVSATGDLMLLAGQQIVLVDGFSVEEGGRFVALIEPWMAE